MIELQCRRRYLAFGSLNMRKVDWNSFLCAIAFLLLCHNTFPYLYDCAFALSLSESVVIYSMRYRSSTKIYSLVVCTLARSSMPARERSHIDFLFVLWLREGAVFLRFLSIVLPYLTWPYPTLPDPTGVELLFLYVWARACFQISIPKKFH